MAMAKHRAMLLALMLGLGCLATNLVAQDKTGDKQEKGDGNQNKNKKPEEGQEQRQETECGALSKFPSAYRLEFALSELDEGKTINTRTYSLLAQVGYLSKLRIGVRVPIPTGVGSAFDYLEIGTNIDYTVEEREDALLLRSSIEVSSMTQKEEQTRQPAIRHMKTELRTVVSPGKPTIVGSIDDPTSKGRFQIEVTATKVK